MLLNNHQNETLWIECKECTELIYEREFIANLRVCPKCNFHHTLPIKERVSSLFDEDTFSELDAEIESSNPLKFKDLKSYDDRLTEYKTKSDSGSAIYAGTGSIHNHPVQFGMFDFSFAGGSMGLAEGEKIVRVFERATECKQPAVIISSSGGARMQEGIFSLLQMAKTSAAIANLRKAKQPFLSILTNPTSGGVTASYAMLGDFHLAEPKALICFTGPRVIKQVIGEELPEGFQSSEFLLEHGMVDRVVHRQDMKKMVGQLLGFLSAK